MWIKYETSETPKPTDIYELGKIDPKQESKLLTHIIKDGTNYLNIQMRVNLSSLKAVEEVSKIFTDINQENKSNSKAAKISSDNTMENVRNSASDFNKRSSKSVIINVILMLILLLLVVCVISVYFLKNTVVNPITAILHTLKDLSEGEGDLTQRLQKKSNDELGTLADYFNTFIEKLHKIIAEIYGNTKSLNTSSQVLSSMSKQIASNTDAMSSQSNIIAGSTEQLSKNIQSVASGAEEMSSSVNTIAAAITEITASLSGGCFKS